MQAGTVYIGHYNPVAHTAYRNICAEYGLEVPWSELTTPPEVIENGRAKNLWDPIQIDKLVMANQLDIVLIDKQQKKAVVIDEANPSDSKIRKKKHTKLYTYQGLKGEPEKMWGNHGASDGWSTEDCD